MVFIISLALLFILKSGFSSNKLITGTLRYKCGGQAVRNFRKVETLWRNKEKTVCDIEYLKIRYSSNNCSKIPPCKSLQTSSPAHITCPGITTETTRKGTLIDRPLFEGITTRTNRSPYNTASNDMNN